MANDESLAAGLELAVEGEIAQELAAPGAAESHWSVAPGAYGRLAEALATPEHQLLDALPAMTFTAGPDGGWEYASPALCAHTGLAQGALRGLGWAELLHAEDRAASLARWQAAIAQGAPFELQQRLRGADGLYGWLRTSCAPQPGAAGAPTRWLGVTALVASEQMVAAEHALRHTAVQSRAERDHVLSIAAHELRAPLTVILGQAKLLLRRLDARAEADPGDRRAAGVMVEQGLRLGRLISALLDTAQIDRGQLHVSATTIDLGALVERAVQMAQMIYPGHTLRARAEGPPICVTGDTLRIEQVLQNLIQNAVKYSPAGSTVSVSLAPAGDQAQISVSDQGSGIAARDQPALFQPFFRSEAAQAGRAAGLGLGLYICKAIMDLHRGSIAVASAEGEGCTVTLRLPRLQYPPGGA